VKRKLTYTLLTLTLLVALPLTARADDVTTADVKRAIDMGIAFLRGQQHGEGSWVYEGGGGWTPGATALAVYALVHSGVPAHDPAVQRGVAYILQQPLNRTYIVSLTLIALAAVDPVQYRAHIERAANWLEDAQLANGQWTYHKMRGGRSTTGDNSNTQFAVLALRDAARAGVKISRSRWSKISAFYRKAQMRDGGWGYQVSSTNTYGSMTAAGICGLAISSRVKQRCPEDCGRRKSDKDLEAGIR